MEGFPVGDLHVHVVMDVRCGWLSLARVQVIHDYEINALLRIPLRMGLFTEWVGPSCSLVGTFGAAQYS